MSSSSRVFSPGSPALQQQQQPHYASSVSSARSSSPVSYSSGTKTTSSTCPVGPHVHIAPLSDTMNLVEDEERNRGGVGLVFVEGIAPNRIGVLTVVNNGPAEEEGTIRVGDLINAVDGRDVVGLPLETVRQLIIGEPNTPCSMSFDRPETKQTYDVTIIRKSQWDMQNNAKLLQDRVNRLEEDKLHERERRAFLESNVRSLENECLRLKDELRRAGSEHQGIVMALNLRLEAIEVEHEKEITRREQALKENLNIFSQEKERIARMEAEIDRKDRLIATLEGEMDALKAKSNVDSEALQSIREAAIGRDAATESTITEKNRMIESLSRDLNHEKAEKESRVNQLEHQIAQLEAAVRSKQEHIATLEKNSSSSNGRIEKMEKKLQELKESRKKMDEQHKQQLEREKGVRMQLEEALGKAEQDLIVEREKRRALEETVKQWKEKYGLSESKRKAAEEFMGKETEEREKAQNEWEKINGELGAMMRERANVEKENAELKMTLKATKGQISRLESSEEKLKLALVRCEEEQRELRLQLNAAESREKFAQRRFTEAEMKMQKLNYCLREFQEREKDIQNQQQDYETRLRECRGLVDTLEQQVDMLSRQLQKKEYEYTALKTQMEAARVKCSNYELCLNEREKEKEELIRLRESVKCSELSYSQSETSRKAMAKELQSMLVQLEIERERRWTLQIKNVGETNAQTNGIATVV